MTVRKIDFYLETLKLIPEHQRLFSNMETITEMQQVFMKIAPLQLARHCAIGGLSEGSLTICADNGAIAAKLRQMLPSLLLKFQAMGYEVTAIRIAVQANYRDIHANAAGSTNPAISEAALKNLSCLAAKLRDDSPLKNAITSLLKKQRKAES